MLTSEPPRGKIVVLGIAFWFPLAGVTYQFLHYLLGLRRLGFDVFYVEDCPRRVYDPDLNDWVWEAQRNVAAIAPILDAHGLSGHWAFRDAFGRCHGMGEADMTRLYREADVLLNVTGSHMLDDQQMRIPRRLYIETDPVVCQIKAADGDAKTLEALRSHDTIFTYGQNIGTPDCPLPTGGFRWLPTRQPVILDFWRGDAFGGNTYTTIGNWSNKGRDIFFNGETYYWSKDREFRKFVDLPRKTSARLELAMGVDDPAALKLRTVGWGLIDPLAISRTLDRYRGYILQSRGEFTVAKDQNVRLRSGWFSDRSCCYLAAGRPVITQDTAFEKTLPTGEGLFAFRTMADILAAIDRIESDYTRASRAAREIAAEYFAAEKVLGSMLSRAGI